MSLYIVILWVTSFAIATMLGGDNSAYVAAMLTIAAIGARGKA